MPSFLRRPHQGMHFSTFCSLTTIWKMCFNFFLKKCKWNPWWLLPQYIVHSSPNQVCVSFKKLNILNTSHRKFSSEFHLQFIFLPYINRAKKRFEIKIKLLSSSVSANQPYPSDYKGFSHTNNTHASGDATPLVLPQEREKEREPKRMESLPHDLNCHEFYPNRIP